MSNRVTILRLLILSVTWITSSCTAPGIVTLKIGIPELIESTFTDESQYNLEFCIGSGRLLDEQCSCLQTQSTSGQYFQSQSYLVEKSFEVDDIKSSFYFNANLSFQSVNKPPKIMRFKDNLFQYTAYNTTQVVSIHSDNYESVQLEMSVKCKTDYYPPFECFRSCSPVPGVHDCDRNGYKICYPGHALLQSTGECVKDMCKVNQGICKNNSTCENEVSSTKCVCKPNFSGIACEKWMPCQQHKCENLAICLERPPPQNYLCQCKDNYYGEYCQNYEDPCKLTTCPTGTLCQTHNQRAICVDLQKSESNYLIPKWFTKYIQSVSSEATVTKKVVPMVVEDTQPRAKETVKVIHYPVQTDFTVIFIIIVLVAFMVCSFTIIFSIQMNKYLQKRKKGTDTEDIFQTPSIIPMRNPEIFDDTLKRWRSMDDGFSNLWYHRNCSRISMLSYKSGFNTCQRPEYAHDSHRLRYLPTTIKTRVSMRNEPSTMDTMVTLDTSGHLNETTQTEDPERVEEYVPMLEDNDGAVSEHSCD